MPGKTNGNKIKSLYFKKKRTKYSFQPITHYYFMFKFVKLIYGLELISDPQSFYFLINYFAIERNEEMTSKKCRESKHCYIHYKLAISVGIKLEL